MLHPSADSSSEESSSEDSESDSDSDPGSDTSPTVPAITLKKTQPVKGSSSDTDSSSDEESSSGEGEDVEMGDHSPVVAVTGGLVVAFVVLKLKLIPRFRETKGGRYSRSPN